MKAYRYIPVEYENKRAASTTSTAHRTIIDAQAAQGFSYAGYVPTRIGPTGKILAVDLIFEK